MAAARGRKPLDLLNANRVAALKHAGKAGVSSLTRLLADAQQDLEDRLKRLGGDEGEGFTVVQMRTALAQIKQLSRDIKKGLGTTVLEATKVAAVGAATGTVKYVQEADKQYRGLSERGLALNPAMVFDRAVSGAQSSILNRILSDPQHPDRPGVLDRYGAAVVQQFERTLAKRLVTGKPWGEVRKELTSESSFLQGAPLYWAERILRTESMYAHNRAGLEAMASIDEQSGGGAVKILCATFDHRTSADSFAVHGQIRRLSEPFDWWGGKYMNPPNRPNDREVVIPHRIEWPLPPELEPKSDAEVAARWALEKRKGAVPPRPNMSTVDRSLFGKVPEEVAVEQAPVQPMPVEQALPPPAAPMEVTQPIEEVADLVPVPEASIPLPNPHEKLFEQEYSGLADYSSGQHQAGLVKAGHVQAQSLFSVGDESVQKLLGEWIETVDRIAKTLPKGKLPVEEISPSSLSVHGAAPQVSLKQIKKAAAPLLVEGGKVPQIKVIKGPDGKYYVADPKDVPFAAAANMLAEAGTVTKLTVRVIDAQKDSSFAFLGGAQPEPAPVPSLSDGAPGLVGGQYVLGPVPAPEAIGPPGEALPLRFLPVRPLPPGPSASEIAQRAEAQRQASPAGSFDEWQEVVTTEMSARREIVPTLHRSGDENFGPAKQGGLVDSAAIDGMRKFTFGYDWTIREYTVGTPIEDLVKARMEHKRCTVSEARQHVEDAIAAARQVERAFYAAKDAPVKTTYRGIGGLTDQQLEQFLGGDTFDMQGNPSSTSLRFQTGINFAHEKMEERDGHGIVLKLHRRSKGVYVEKITACFGEQEVVVHGNSQWRILQRTRGKDKYGHQLWVIEAEEI